MLESLKARDARWGFMPVLASLACVTALLELPTQPRFTYEPLNYAATLLLIFSVPASLMWLATYLQLPAARWGVAVLGVLVAIPAILIAVFVLDDLQNILKRGSDGSYELVDELAAASATYRLYRTNGGATTSFGLSLRRESPFVPGLKLVSFMRAFYPAHDADFELLPSGEVELRVAAYGSSDRGNVYVFRP